MKMKIDLSKFKLKHKDDKIATLMHPDGHEVRIAINALHPMNRKNLESLQPHETVKEAEGGEMEYATSPKATPGHEQMPTMYAKGGTAVRDAKDPTQRHLLTGDRIPNAIEKGVISHATKMMAEGGQMNPKLEESKKSPRMYAEGDSDVQADSKDDSPEAIAKDAAQQAATPDVNVNINGAPQSPQPQSADLGQTQNQVSQMSQAPGGGAAPVNQQPPQQQSYQPGQLPNPTGGLEQQMKGVSQVSEAAQQQAEDDTAALAAQAGAQAHIQQEYMKNHKAIDDEIKNFTSDIANQKIDYHRYLGNMNTGQKIGTAIGLILGGIGGQGKSNQAADFLNRQIDRDIEQQRAQLGQKETIFSANLKRLGNDLDATNMSRAMMQSQLTNQLAQNAAKSGSLRAQGIANQTIGPIQNQVDMFKNTQAMRQLGMTGGQTQPGELSDVDPALLLPALQGDPAVKAEAAKEMNKLKEAKQLKTGLQQSFQNIHNKILAGTFSPNDTLSAQQAYAGPLAKLMEGRFNLEESKAQIKALMPGAFDSGETRANRMQRIDQMFEPIQQSTTNLKQIGINPEKFKATSLSREASLTPQQQKWAAYAKAHPENPQSAVMLKKLGIQ